MDHLSIYGAVLPENIALLTDTPPMRRLRGVGMNCGCEYTSFPRFCGIRPYTRFEHSLGAAMIVRRFTNDDAQTVSALLHDIATPVFAHVVDFMRGDHLTQTSTESGTAVIIRGSSEICALLGRLGLSPEDVEDYHRYPVADNDTPRLSADRLEYTCGNAINFGFADANETEALLADIEVGSGEDGSTELVFRTPEKALRFAAISLECSRIYVCDADRYSMQRLSELLRAALDAGVISPSDLAGTESAVIEKLCADGRFAERWREFRAMSRTRRAGAPDGGGEWRMIKAKKRYIDPYIVGCGRASRVFPEHGRAVREFLGESHDYYVCGE